MVCRIALVALMAILSLASQVRGQVIQSSGLGSGLWNDPTSWSPNTVPTNVNSTSVVINGGHLISVGSNVIVDQLSIDGALVINSGFTLTIANGSGTDLTIGSGSLQVSGVITGSNGWTFSGMNTGNTSFLSGSRYRHLYTTTEGALPLATWNVTSTVEIAGYTSSITASASGNWNQSFGNFIYNCSAQSFFSVVDFAGNLVSIAGDLILLATNSGPSSQGSIVLSSGQNPTVNVGGDVIIQGTSRFYFSTSGVSTTLNIGGDLMVSSTNTKGYGITTAGTCIVDIEGDFSLNALGARFYLANGAGIATMRLDGDFNFQNGSFLGSGNLQFTGTDQNFNSVSLFPNAVNYLIGPTSNLNVGTNVLGGSGTFTLQGTIRLGSTEPTGAIANNTSLGNLRTPLATRDFQAGSTIVYGSPLQQFIGLGNPTASNINVEIDNSSIEGVTLASSISLGGNLNLTLGTLNIGNQTLTLNGNVNVISGNIGVISTSNIIVNGTGAFGSLPFSSNPTTLNNFTINRTSGSVSIADDLIIAGILTLSNGNLAFDNQTLTLNGTLSRSGGLLSGNSLSTLTIGGTAGLGSSVAFSGGGNTIGNLTINRPGTGNVSFTSTLNVASSVNLLTGGLVNSGTIMLSNGATVTRNAGNLNTNRFSNSPGNSYNLVYTGSGITTGLELPDPANVEDLNNLTFSGGTIANNQNFVVNGAVLFSSGTFQNGFRIITMEGSDWQVNGGNFMPETGEVIFNGNTTLAGSGTISFNRLTLASGATLTMPASNVNVGSNFTLTSGSVFNDNGGTITANGASSQNISANGETLHTIIVNKTGGALSFTSTTNLIGLLNIQSATVVNANGNLTLISSTDGPTGNASIGAIASGGSVSGTVRVQRYFSAADDVNRYISSPVSNATVSQFQTSGVPITGKFTGTSFPCTGCENNGANLKWYNESISGDLNLFGYTATPTSGGNNNQTLVRSVGYALYQWNSITPSTVTFSGTINAGTFNFLNPLGASPAHTTSTPTPIASADGWNLVGNPYPSTIRWDNGAGWSRTNIDPTIWVWDVVQQVWRSFNAATSVGDLPNGLLATGQAFWVYVPTPGTASITINENAKFSSGTGSYYRTEDHQQNASIISLTDGISTDNAFLQFNNLATDKFDVGIDAPKFEIGIERMQIAFKEEGLKMGHYSAKTDEKLSIRISVMCRDEGVLSLKIANSGLLKDMNYRYLIDTKESVCVPIKEGVVYSFSHMVSDNTLESRFYLSNSALKTEEIVTSNSIDVYPNPASGKTFIVSNECVPIAIKIINSSGVSLGHIKYNITDSNNVYELDLNEYAEGIYIIRIETDKGFFSKRILLDK